MHKLSELRCAKATLVPIALLMGLGAAVTAHAAPLPPACTGDSPHYRSLIDEFLGDPNFQQIRQNVGVNGVSPGTLAVITNKKICNSLRAELTIDVVVSGPQATHQVYFFRTSSRLFMLIAPIENQADVILEPRILYVFTTQYVKLGTILL